MKLWLDDIRNPAEYGCAGWTWVKTAGQAIAALKSGTVTAISLDYDILWDEGGNDQDWEDRRTGYAVAKWMADNGAWPREGVRIHSSNQLGRKRMRAVLGNHYHETPASEGRAR